MRSVFFTGVIYDASSIIFADDITKRTVTKTPQEVITKVEKVSKLLKNIAADIGIVMNQSKEEHQVGFVGPGSVKSMRTLYKGNRMARGYGGNCALRRGSWVHCSHPIAAMWLRGKPAFGQHRLDGR